MINIFEIALSYIKIKRLI